MGKYLQEAVAKDNHKNEADTNLLTVLPAIAELHQGSYVKAVSLLTEVQANDNSEINQVCTVQDVAFYTTIYALNHLSRQDLKDKVIASSKFKAHAESVPELSEIIEHYLNGRYDEFNQCLGRIHEHLRFDTVLGTKLERTLLNIKRKAIIQYVAPYKVVDLKQVAAAFHLTLEEIEGEIAHLIVTR